jgi:branched-chain amino acid transport system ATP-binding protein
MIETTPRSRPRPTSTRRGTRALAADPRLLLDDWLAGLKHSSKLLIGIDLIPDIGRDGCTIIMVEHVMDAIRRLCSRCVVMNS